MCWKDVKLEKKARIKSAFFLLWQDIFLFLTPFNPHRSNSLQQALKCSSQLGDSFNDSFSTSSPSSFSLHLHPLSYFQVVSDQHRISAPHTLTGIAPLLCQILTYHQLEILLSKETEQSYAPIIPACDFHMRFSSTRQNWPGPLTFNFT